MPKPDRDQEHRQEAERLALLPKADQTAVVDMYRHLVHVHLVHVAEAIRVYLKQTRHGLEAQNSAAEVKIYAEVKLGKLLAEPGERRGGRSKLHDGTLINGTPQSLPEGITKSQSSRWKKIAS